MPFGYVNCHAHWYPVTFITIPSGSPPSGFAMVWGCEYRYVELDTAPQARIAMTITIHITSVLVLLFT
ncbi:MAG: hypothetical protein QXU70_04630, partial [Thermoplasmatales archaeon]